MPLPKSIFLAAQTCSRKAWLLHHGHGSTTPSPADRFRMDEGEKIGGMARSLFPDGLLVQGDLNGDLTLQFIANPATTTIFEAAFHADGFIAKADILRRDSSGWHIIEVKASLEDTAQLDHLIDDLVYTVMIAKRSGLNVFKASLMLISRDYRLGMPTDRLFVEMDQTAVVMDRLTAAQALLPQVNVTMGASTAPPPKLISECRSCEFFESACLGRDVEHSLFELPRLHVNRVAQLADLGVVAVKAIPDDFPLTDIQQRVTNAVKTGTAFVNGSMKV